VKQNQENIGVLGIVIILLTVATAAIHISLLFPDVVFILNGLGYLSLAGAYFLPFQFFRQRRRLIGWAYMGFTLITILLWVFMGERSTLGYATKAIEVALLLSLWFYQRRR